MLHCLQSVCVVAICMCCWVLAKAIVIASCDLFIMPVVISTAHDIMPSRREGFHFSGKCRNVDESEIVKGSRAKVREKAKKKWGNVSGVVTLGKKK